MKTGIQQQRGAALIIGLVLLTVLTLLTASSMTASTLSLRMADNVKQQEIAQQAAESALMQALTSTEPYTLNGTILIDNEVRNLLTYNYIGNGAGDATTEVKTFLRDRLSPLGDCDISATGGCTYQHFKMNAVTTSSRGGTQTQSMGYYIEVPSN